MIASMDYFFNEAKRTIVPVFNQFVQLHDLRAKANADHICYKCDSQEMYDTIRRVFEPHARITQDMISNRRVALIQLPKPLGTILGDIRLLELSDQNPQNSQTAGFHHIEIYPTGNTHYRNLVAHVQSRGLDVQEIPRAHHTTHDLHMTPEYILRLTREPLLQKVCGEMIQFARP